MYSMTSLISLYRSRDFSEEKLYWLDCCIYRVALWRSIYFKNGRCQKKMSEEKVERKKLIVKQGSQKLN